MSNDLFQYVDETSIDENYKCNICNEPFLSPVTTRCDHTYCDQCLQRWFNEGYSSCPTCREELTSDDIQPVKTRLVLNILDRLEVRCLQCDQRGIQRGNFLDHQNKFCPKMTIQCSSADVQCPWTGQRDQLETHLAICHYQQLKPFLNNLIQTNQRLEEQVQLLSNQLEILQSAVQSSKLRWITFDKLSSSNDSGPIVKSYENLIFSNAWYMHQQWVKQNHSISGWNNAFTNGHVCVIFNGQGNSMSISTKNPSKEKFSLISFEGTSAWHDDLRIDLIGRRHNEEIYSMRISLQYDRSLSFHPNWKDIDQIQFLPIDGKSHSGNDYSEKYFALTSILIA